MKKLPILFIAGFTAALVACEGGADDVEVPEGEVAVPLERDALEEQPADDLAEARELVNDAAETANKMTADPGLQTLLQQARGVLIVPDYGRAAVGVGVRGGEGVLLTRRDGGWSAPAFYDIGAVSVGPQLGASGGEIAMLLMTDRAVNSFQTDNTFSLNANAGFVLVDYSAIDQANVGKGDVILWSDTEGAFAGVSLGASDISFDEEEARAYYGRQVTPNDVLTGTVTAPANDPLQNAFGPSN